MFIVRKCKNQKSLPVQKTKRIKQALCWAVNSLTWWKQTTLSICHSHLAIQGEVYFTKARRETRQKEQELGSPELWPQYQQWFTSELGQTSQQILIHQGILQGNRIFPSHPLLLCQQSGVRGNCQSRVKVLCSCGVPPPILLVHLPSIPASMLMPRPDRPWFQKTPLLLIPTQPVCFSYPVNAAAPSWNYNNTNDVGMDLIKFYHGSAHTMLFQVWAHWCDLHNQQWPHTPLAEIEALREGITDFWKFKPSRRLDGCRHEHWM